MSSRPAIVVLAIVESIIVFVGTMFLVAWLLEDVIEFSLLVGIPAGLIAGAVVFVIQTSLCKRDG